MARALSQVEFQQCKAKITAAQDAIREVGLMLDKMGGMHRQERSALVKARQELDIIKQVRSRGVAQRSAAKFDVNPYKNAVWYLEQTIRTKNILGEMNTLLRHLKMKQQQAS